MLLSIACRLFLGYTHHRVLRLSFLESLFNSQQVTFSSRPLPGVKSDDSLLRGQDYLTTSLTNQEPGTL